MVHQKETKELIGKGFIVYDEEGDSFGPFLFDLQGNHLPEAWYSLQFTDEEKPCILPLSVQ